MKIIKVRSGKLAIEYQEINDDYEIVIVLQPLGHRCGYVGVPTTHILFGISYNEKIVSNIDVHGGLTYSGSKFTTLTLWNEEKNRWYFGFDCAHLGDKPDIETMKKYGTYTETTKFMELGYYAETDIVRTFEYVKSECDNLLRQIKEATK